MDSDREQLNEIRAELLQLTQLVVQLSHQVMELHALQRSKDAALKNLLDTDSDRVE